MTDQELLAEALRVVRMEAGELERAAGRLGPEFAKGVRLIAGRQGRLIVSGIGKSGIIGRKIAATMTSTGTPASFLHPIDSLHGDLGIVQKDDVVVALSQSGETAELVRLLEAIRRIGARLVSITGRPETTLGQASDVTLRCRVAEEACPLNLAPTASTTAALALGDALAVACLEARGFGKEDFTRSHPGGALGRRGEDRVRPPPARPGRGRRPLTFD